MPPEFTGPYIDPDTGVLRNLPGARTYDELANAEGELVCARTGELLAGDIPPLAGSLDDLCAIHRILFQDVFDWAGTPRTIEIRKNVERSEFFLPSQDIARGALWAQGELETDGMLAGMDLDRFAKHLAYH